MKQNLMNEVIQGMLPFLNNAQMERLQEVLQHTLFNYKVVENNSNKELSEQNLVELFLAAKRIEGCSEKSLKYYESTILALLDALEKAQALDVVNSKQDGLDAIVEQNGGNFSGGQKQRISIARALAKNPKLLLCDEPTGALDYNTGKAILKLLQDTAHETGMTVVIITHNLAIAPMADRIIHVKNGTVSAVELNENRVPVENIEW